MNTRVRTHARAALQLFCMRLVICVALMLAAVIATEIIWHRAREEDAATTVETQLTQQQIGPAGRRDFVMLQDIELVRTTASHAATNPVSQDDVHFIKPANLEQHVECSNIANMPLTEAEKECAARQKVCIGFFGITRSTIVTHRSAWQHLLNPITCAGAKLKVFLHTYNLSHAENERAGEKNVKLDREEWKLLKPHVTMFEDQDRVDPMVYDEVVQVMLKKYKEYMQMFKQEPRSVVAFRNTMMNIGREGYSINRVAKLMEGHGCTRVVLARPDVIFVNNINTRQLLQCNMPDNTWYVPAFGKNGGINDRMAFGNFDSMKVYGEQLWHMREYTESKPMQKEVFLHALSVKMKMHIRFFNMCFFRTRANHLIERRDIVKTNCCNKYLKTQAELKDLRKLGIDVNDREGMYLNLTTLCLPTNKFS